MNNLANETMVTNNMKGIRKGTLYDAVALVLTVIIVELGICSSTLPTMIPRKVAASEIETLISDPQTLEDCVYTTGVNSYINDLLTMDIEPVEQSEEISVEEEVVEEEEVIPVYEFEKVGYTTTLLNIRSMPTTDSEVIGYIEWNTEVHYSVYDDEWYVIDNNGEYAYISSRYISTCSASYKAVYSVNEDKRKSCESYKAITCKSSKQYEIQQQCVTDSEGFRLYKGRYTVAIGTGFNAPVGTYLDVVLEDGTVINCIVGDIKKDKDTDSTNTIGNDGGVVEFIAHIPSLDKLVKGWGDASYTNDWECRVVELRIYAHQI